MAYRNNFADNRCLLFDHTFTLLRVSRVNDNLRNILTTSSSTLPVLLHIFVKLDIRNGSEKKDSLFNICNNDMQLLHDFLMESVSINVSVR